ncbi:MAG: hypothetical protein H6889_15020 [Brucellaceae bacterium]|nr:hypothetical protein [Brucellaceae bacterium]
MAKEIRLMADENDRSAGHAPITNGSARHEWFSPDKSGETWNRGVGRLRRKPPFPALPAKPLSLARKIANHVDPAIAKRRDRHGDGADGLSGMALERAGSNEPPASHGVARRNEHG